MCDGEYIRTCDIRMEREVNQILWHKVMGDLGQNWDNTFENDTFVVRAYDWDDEYHNNDWHFWHKPSGFKLEWYKYPLRSPWSNIEVSHEEFLQILYDCHNSTQIESPRIFYDCDKWWEREDEEV